MPSVSLRSISNAGSWIAIRRPLRLERRVTRRSTALDRKIQSDRAADDAMFDDGVIENWRRDDNNRPGVFKDHRTPISRPASPGPTSKSKKSKTSRAKSHRPRSSHSSGSISPSPTKKFFLKIQKLGSRVVKFKCNGTICGQWEMTGKYKFTSRVVELTA